MSRAPRARSLWLFVFLLPWVQGIRVGQARALWSVVTTLGAKAHLSLSAQMSVCTGAVLLSGELTGFFQRGLGDSNLQLSQANRFSPYSLPPQSEATQ